MLLETRLPNLLHRGKVRDTYAVNDELLLMVATDRISAFDVVLPDGIPDKGRVAAGPGRDPALGPFLTRPWEKFQKKDTLRQAQGGPSFPFVGSLSNHERLILILPLSPPGELLREARPTPQAGRAARHPTSARYNRPLEKPG